MEPVVGRRPRAGGKMSLNHRIAVGVALAGLLPGCAGVQPRVAERPPAGAAPAPSRGVVFCADGSGGFGTTSAALTNALAEQRQALDVRPVAWTHGFGRVLADQVDAEHARAEGQQLAEEVLAWEGGHPGQPA